MFPFISNKLVYRKLIIRFDKDVGVAIEKMKTNKDLLVQALNNFVNNLKIKKDTKQRNNDKLELLAKEWEQGFAYEQSKSFEDKFDEQVEQAKDNNRCSNYIFELSEFKYYVQWQGQAKGFVPISNFILEIVKMITNEADNTAQTMFKVLKKFDKGTYTLNINNGKLANINEFRVALKLLDPSLFLNSSLDDILVISTADGYKKVKGLSTIAFHGDKFVTTKGAFNKDFSPADNVCYSLPHEYITSDIDKNNDITLDELQQLLPHLFKYNELSVCASILSYCCACLLNTEFEKANYKLSRLHGLGEAGSGKTTSMETIILNFFSISYTPLIAYSVKEFGLLRFASSSNTIPLIIDEFKANKLSNNQLDMLSNFFRSSYDKHSATRGLPNQEVRRFKLSAPVVVIGEHRTTEKALLDRAITVNFSKQNITPQRTKSLKWLQNNTHLIKKLGYSLLKHRMDGCDIKALIDEIPKIQKEVFSEGRIKTGIALYAIGYRLLEDFLLKRFNIELKGDLKYNNIVDIMDTMQLTETETSGGKSSLLQTIEAMDMLADGGLVENEDYKFINNNTELALDIKRIYPILLKYISDYKLKDEYEILTQAQFTKELMRQEFFVAYRDVRLTDNKSKCYILDIIKLSNVCSELRVFKIENPFDSE